MDTTNWIPLRWPCGPLVIERDSRREGLDANARDALEQWGRPETLERLRETPFNCLVVPWAGGTPADGEHQGALPPLITAARGAGLAVVGEVAASADLRPAASAAEGAGLQALTTASTAPLSGFPVLRFGQPSVEDRSPRPFMGVHGLPWPGMKVDVEELVDAWSGPTGPPWINSNGWFVRLARELVAPDALWLSYEPPESGVADPGSAYVQALADAAVYGARWVVSLDRGARVDLARGRGPGQETWDQIIRAAEFLEAHRSWTDLQPVGVLGVVSDFAGPNEWLSFEVLNLLSRHSRLYRTLDRGTLAASPGADPFSGLAALLYVDEAPPGKDLLERLYAFAEAGGTLVTPPSWEWRGEPEPRSTFRRFRVSRLGQGRLAVAREELADPYRVAEDAQALMSHRHDRVRVFNPGTGRFAYSRSADGRSGVLHLFPYARYSFETHVSAWFREPWSSAQAWQPGSAGPEPAARTVRETGVEFLLPPEPEVRRARSTNSDDQVRPAAAYRALELSS